MQQNENSVIRKLFCRILFFMNMSESDFESIQNLAVNRDCYNLPRNELSAVFECVFCGVFKSAATWNFHSDNGNALNIIIGDNLCQLFAVINIVKLGTADERYLPRINSRCIFAYA